MPFYKYKCKKCNSEQEKRISYKYRDSVFMCECGNKLTRIILSPEDFIVTEVSDKYRNKSTKKNIKEILKKRTREHTKNKIGEIIEDKGLKDISRTRFIKNNRKATVWDEK